MGNQRWIYLLVCIWFSQIAPSFSQGGFSFANPNHRSITIPIEVHNNLILVDLSINGSFPFKFILDTGVRTALLTEPVLTGFFSMQNTTDIRVLGLGEGEVIHAKKASGLVMQVGGVVGQDLNMIILPEGAVSYSGMFGKPVVGIIGYDFFKNFVVEIHYSRKFIRLYNPKHYKPKKKATAIPIELINKKPYIKARVADHRGSEVLTRWLIDTGASQALSIYHEDIETPNATLDAFIGRGLSGDMYGKIGRVQRFEMADYAFEGVVAGYPDTASIRWVIGGDTAYANLGAEILSRFLVTLDYGNYKLYLKKNSRFKKPFLYNTSGLEAVALHPDFTTYEIVYVRPGSPAQKAGILIGDELLTVNGLDVGTLEIGDVHVIINREPGKRVRLKVRRNGVVIKKKFMVEGEI